MKTETLEGTVGLAKGRVDCDGVKDLYDADYCIKPENNDRNATREIFSVGMMYYYI